MGYKVNLNESAAIIKIIDDESRERRMQVIWYEDEAKKDNLKYPYWNPCTEIISP